MGTDTYTILIPCSVGHTGCGESKRGTIIEEEEEEIRGCEEDCI
jgi:hypothetical protein